MTCGAVDPVTGAVCTSHNSLYGAKYHLDASDPGVQILWPIVARRASGLRYHVEAPALPSHSPGRGPVRKSANMTSRIPRYRGLSNSDQVWS